MDNLNPHKKVSLGVPLILHEAHVSDDIWDPFQLSEEEFEFIAAAKTSGFSMVSEQRPEHEPVVLSIKIDLYLDGTLKV